MIIKLCSSTKVLRRILPLGILPMMLLGPLASGDNLGNAETLLNQQCMQEVWAAAEGNPSKTLNCTANDISIASATNISFPTDDKCDFEGDTTTFTATFEFLLTAQARHDAGVWFATDGDLEGDGALVGTCAASTPAYGPEPDWLDLDGTLDKLPGTNVVSNIQDTCGDIDDDHNPLFPEITLTVVCKAGPERKLLLPYCTSWRQPGSNELCTSPDEAIPGSPSKCKCDAGFTIDIDVPLPKFDVTKTATPTSVKEPGGSVRYDITVDNTNVDPFNRLTITSMLDDIYGDITSVQGDITQTDCANGTVICSGAAGNLPGSACAAPDVTTPYACSFYANATGNGGTSIKDIVIVSGTDNNGNTQTGQDDATVTITDEVPFIQVTKTANPTSVLEPGANVSFSVVVKNTSTASSDPVTISTLSDDIHGNLDGQGDCSVPQVIAQGASYSCSFTALVSGNAGDSETDTVTASGTDDEGNPVSDTDTATVAINDVPSDITLLKTVSPDSLPEPGGNVDYTFKVTNISTVDSVDITSLTDDQLGNLNGMGDCSVPQTLAPGGVYSCGVSGVALNGNAGENHKNVATASGKDDDGNDVSAMDDANVDFTNVPPAASLTKTAKSAAVTYEVKVCNESTAEALTVSTLSDDIYGDITQVAGDITASTCDEDQSISAKGEAGDCYTCSFTATATDDVTDTVTATVDDDDGSSSVQPSDSATVTLD